MDMRRTVRVLAPIVTKSTLHWVRSHVNRIGLERDRSRTRCVNSVSRSRRQRHRYRAKHAYSIWAFELLRTKSLLWTGVSSAT